MIAQNPGHLSTQSNHTSLLANYKGVKFGSMHNRHLSLQCKMPYVQHVAVPHKTG
jgi:hypothetical protein